MSRVQWTPVAERDLDDIFDYIAEISHRPQTAAQILRDINEKATQYARQSGMGSRRSDLPEHFRFFVHKRYVVVYEPLDDGIRVHGVVDGARDWPRLFGRWWPSGPGE